MLDTRICPICKTPVINWVASVCPECFGGDSGIRVPNQRELLDDEQEQQALQTRYKQAKQDCNSTQIAELETVMQTDSKAVINIDAEDLASFLKNAKKLYANYQHQVDAEIRLPAEMINDKKRLGTEGDLFGSYAKNIHYAALSLTDKGLDSYGDSTVVLKDESMKWRASVLEENSFDFREKHAQHIVVEKKGIPKGYRAVWAERHLLAVAKLASKLNGIAVNLPALLLKTEDNRHTDDFMEVHIYGGVSHQTIAKILAPQNSPDFSRISERATHLGIECLAA